MRERRGWNSAATNNVKRAAERCFDAGDIDQLLGQAFVQQVVACRRDLQGGFAGDRRLHGAE